MTPSAASPAFAASLPAGRRGQAFALTLTAVALAAVWFGLIAPALGWYADRSEYLQQQRILAGRMAAVAATAPALQQQLAQTLAAPPPRAVFEGATDAVAGAALQQAVQDIAGHTGTTVLSAEVLPVQPVGLYHRIGVRISVSGSWRMLVALLGATVQATPRMLVDDLGIRQTDLIGARGDRSLEASFTVTALHVPAAAAPPG